METISSTQGQTVNSQSNRTYFIMHASKFKSQLKSQAEMAITGLCHLKSICFKYNVSVVKLFDVPNMGEDNIARSIKWQWQLNGNIQIVQKKMNKPNPKYKLGEHEEQWFNVYNMEMAVKKISNQTVYRNNKKKGLLQYVKKVSPEEININNLKYIRD